jgi:hypothetical protein
VDEKELNRLERFVYLKENWSDYIYF